jgi:hypothetical protein
MKSFFYNYQHISNINKMNLNNYIIKNWMDSKNPCSFRIKYTINKLTGM